MLAAAALAVSRSLPGASARYRVLAAAFLCSAALAPLALVSATLRSAPPGGVAPAAVASLAAALALPALLIVALVAGVLLLELAADVGRLRRVKRGATPLGTVAVRGARIGSSPTVEGPTAIGYVHPAVVLPDDFRTRVDAREWDAVLAHECAHLARWDDWGKAVQSAILRAGWWLPGLWLLARGLDLERELASDERAACATGARRYAACLLRLASGRAALAAPGFGGRRSHVAIRVERLLRPAQGAQPVVRAAALGAFTALVFASFGGAAVVLPGTAARAPSPERALGAPRAARTAARHAAARKVAARPVHRPAAPAKARVALVPPVAIVRAKVVAPAPARPSPKVRRESASQTLAWVAPRIRCTTCFGPLRSPDAVSPPTEATAPSGLSDGGSAGGSASAFAEDDSLSGPVSLGTQNVWVRIPMRVAPSP